MPTMTISYLVFPEGTPVPGLSPMPIFVPPDIEEMGFPAPVEANYTFAFWNNNGGYYATQTLPPFLTPSTDFSVTAWYIAEFGPPPRDVTTFLFSLNQNGVVPGLTPIQSVSPPKDWTGPPSTVVSTAASSATIEATPLSPGLGRFTAWVQFLGGPAPVGPQLVAPEGSAGPAIAIYGIPKRDPCAGIRATIAVITNALGEMYNRKLAEMLTELVDELAQCEKENGEL